VLAAANPKFNPRYLMMVSPAYLLLLAGGIAALWSLGRIAARVGAVLLVMFLVLASAIGIRNWFADPAFTKTQWRELTAYVRSQRAADEGVLLVSGHAHPAWDYYAADMPAARLPAIDILDVDRVLGFASGKALEGALAGKAGAWLVEWQNEVIDPAGFVPFFLDRAGKEQPAGREFWHLGLRHWLLAPDATYPTEPQPQLADAVNFDHKLALIGWDSPQDGKVGREITAYWRVLNSLTRDYQVSLTVEDAAGNEVGRWDGRPAGYGFPTTRWQVGQSYFGRYPLPLPTDAPPGEYYVTIAVYDAENPSGLDIRDVADNPAGKRVWLGPIVVE
jgi:hypothetical protein